VFSLLSRAFRALTSRHSMWYRSTHLETRHWQAVLVIRHRFIGDTLLLHPFLNALRRMLPASCRIDVAVTKGSGELLEGHPAVHRLVYLDAPKAINRLAKEHYNAAFVLKRSWSSLLIAIQAGIPIRIGFATEGRDVLLTHPITYPNKGGHEAEAFLTCLAPLVLPEGMPAILALEDVHDSWQHWKDYVLPVALQSQLEEDIRNNRCGILIHAFASNPGKEWPLPHWVSLLQQMYDAAQAGTIKPLSFYAIGSERDAVLYRQLQAALPSDFRLTVCCGTLTLPQSGVLMRSLYMAIGVDSGPMHLAATAVRHVISLFGPMDADRWHPIVQSPQTIAVLRTDLPCQPCHLKTPCPIEFQCMRELSPERVWEHIYPLLISG
jgi:heptosyltransferase II